MAHVEGEIVIARPVEEVFDFVADERNEPRYNPRMLRVEKLTPGPIGVGARFHAEMKTMRRPAGMTIEFTGYDRPTRLASTTDVSTMEIRGTLTFRSEPDGTRLRWNWEIEAQGLLRLLDPLVARLGERQERAIWTGLKELLEQTPTTGVA
jgi:carbon monoxide dehydrogenase subunit G